MRFGHLISFGDVVFNDVGAISRAVSGWPLSFEASYETGLVSVGRSYPFDTQGLSAAPLHEPTVTYEYILYAGVGIPAAQAFAQLEAQWRTIWTQLQGSYIGHSGAATSGQKGPLVVADADLSVGTRYIATARALKPAPWKLARGSPYALSVEIPFALLSDFTAI